MSNVLITEKCNRKCSFCFARNYTHSRSGAAVMSLDEIETIKSFAIRSGKKELRLLGGEPTLHPRFIEIVQNALNDDFHIHLFTNGMMPGSTADFLGQIPKTKLSILCNVSPQANESKVLLQRREYVFDKLRDLIMPGLTISSCEFDFEFVLEMIKRFDLKRKIRIGIAQPVIGYGNAYLDPKDYPKIGPILTQMARRCVEDDVLIGFDCGMTMCMFTEEELGVLTTCSQGFHSRCTPIIDIGPGLNVWHCFPLFDVYRSHLNYFYNREAVNKYYTDLLKPYKNIGCMPQCLRCDFRRREQCTGGCIAHAINSLEHLPGKIFSNDLSPQSL